MAKILVIDDESGVRSYFMRLLTKLGYEVVTAADSTTGLTMAADPTVDLIISDLNLPGETSSLEFVCQLRKLRKECPIVVISGYPTSDRLKGCEDLGVAEFLTKPFEISFVSSILERLLPKKD